MRILAVCNLFPPYVVGGNEVRLQEILAVLKERNEIAVLSGEYAEGGDWDSVEVVRKLKQLVPYPKPFGKHKLLLAKEWLTAWHNYGVATEVVGRFKPDVVYMSDTKRVYLGAAFAVVDRGIPLVWEMTDLSLKHYTHRPYLRRWLPLTDIRKLPFGHSIPISQFIKDELMQAGILGQEATVINQGVYLDQYVARPPLAQGDRPRKLLFVGSLVEQKGLHIVLAALKLLSAHSADYSLTVCGDSADQGYKDKIRRYVEKNQLGDAVRFLGKVPRETLPEIYRRHDIFVFSSVDVEALASTPMEAMACNVPVVGTLVGGQRDFFAHGVNSLAYDKDDPRDLSEKIQALNDTELYRRIAATALQQARAEFDFGQYAGSIEQVLKKAVAAKAG